MSGRVTTKTKVGDTCRLIRSRKHRRCVHWGLWKGDCTTTPTRILVVVVPHPIGLNGAIGSETRPRKTLQLRR